MEMETLPTLQRRMLSTPANSSGSSVLTVTCSFRVLAYPRYLTGYVGGSVLDILFGAILLGLVSLGFPLH